MVKDRNLSNPRNNHIPKRTIEYIQSQIDKIETLSKINNYEYHGRQ